MSSLSSVFVLSRSVCCLRRRCGACNACCDAGNARPGAAASVGACSWLRASEFTAHARVLLWHVCACDFVRPADRVIKHNVFCVCVVGPCFLYALVYFVGGATCWLGQRSTTPSLLCHVVGFCIHARAHTGLRSHVTFFHEKERKNATTQTVLTHQRRVLLVGPDTH